MSKPSENTAADLAEIRAQLAPASGPDYWRSLEELAGTEKFQHYLHREFPENATEWADPESRRHFLKLMGASIALAGVSGCAIREPEQIAPWTKSPEQIVPGRPQFYATAMTLGGLATGVLVESHAGRPTKIEGNPDHPASLGSTDVFAQASTLMLYDPDRSQQVLIQGQVGHYGALYDDFLAVLTAEMDRFRTWKGEDGKEKKGAGLRILTEAVGSPSLANQIKELLAAFPEAKWHRFEGVARDHSREGSRLAFGEVVDPVYRFDRADVILALDADFLACGSPGRVADERAFAARREPKAGVMNRLYAAEGTFTNTGAAADHRLAIRPSQIADLALAIAAGVGVEGAPAVPDQSKADPLQKWAAVVAKDLKDHKGKALVLVGEAQPPYVHALGHAINQAIGAIGPEGTVTFIEPIEADPVEHGESLAGLIKDIQAGQVDTLLILGGNPVYTAPANLDFAAALKKVPLSIRLGSHVDETSEHCIWHIPEAHFLESWSDARAFDGTASIVQPLIFPLYNGKTAHELVAAMMGQFDRSPLNVVRDYWRGQKGNPADFEATWRKALHDGKIEGTAAKPKEVKLKSFDSFGPKPAAPSGGTEIIFRPDPTIWDGRFNNCGWLQELPKPITKLTWDNAALISPATARKLKLDIVGGNGRVAEIRYRGKTLEIPVFIVPGQADDTVVVHLGYGRTKTGQVGTGTGFNANAIRHSEAPWGGPGAEIAITDRTYTLASTQPWRNIDGRDLIRVASLADFIKDPGFVHKGEEHSEGSLASPTWEAGYEKHYRWGMAIDLNACTGCNACVIACQSENNIPVVGKGQVEAGRLMQWIEIDTYFSGDVNQETGQVAGPIDAYFQPRTCMHCENAPCELVCPVGATLHDAEGLNVMVYNRCVGTRYCGNNCPYKVRHFNFLNYFEESKPQLDSSSLKLLNNPDVTVRSRGVMEKCTYCIQRISGARISAKERGEKIRDGEVRTACQAACPARAIHFGDLNDKSSEVYKIKQEERDYAMLGSLKTQPRTTYLGKIRNPNPELNEA